MDNTRCDNYRSTDNSDGFSVCVISSNKGTNVSLYLLP